MATLEKELQLSRHEVETLIEAINSTMEESKKIERDLISIQVIQLLAPCRGLLQKYSLGGVLFLVFLSYV